MIEYKQLKNWESINITEYFVDLTHSVCIGIRIYINNSKFIINSIYKKIYGKDINGKKKIYIIWKIFVFWFI